MTEIDELKEIIKKHEKRISDLEKSLKSKPTIKSLDGEKIILNFLSYFFHNWFLYLLLFF